MSQQVEELGDSPAGISSNSQLDHSSGDAPELAPAGDASAAQVASHAEGSSGGAAHAVVLEPNDPADETGEPNAFETGDCEGDEEGDLGEDAEAEVVEEEDEEEEDELVMPPVDEDQLAMLVDFGFPEVRRSRLTARGSVFVSNKSLMGLFLLLYFSLSARNPPHNSPTPLRNDDPRRRRAAPRRDCDWCCFARFRSGRGAA